MNTIIFASIILSLLAQLAGFRAHLENTNFQLHIGKITQAKEFRAYFDASNSYRLTPILLPSAIFIGLTMMTIIVLALLGWGSDEVVLPIFGNRDRIPIFIIGYLFFGALINLIASVFFFVAIKFLLPIQPMPFTPNQNPNSKLLL